MGNFAAFATKTGKDLYNAQNLKQLKLHALDVN